jgi:hypothetical protein
MARRFVTLMPMMVTIPETTKSIGGTPLRSKAGFSSPSAAPGI